MVLVGLERRMTEHPHDAHAASDPQRSAWVSANAGAGKTYTLANRVTRLLLDGAKPERILCLTYTKAAAAEMAGRLFAQLGDWSMVSDADLAERIAAIGAEPRDRQGLREARRLFALALETPGGLKIQTIHSFCQYLLARFPLEAGVPPAFRILDDETGHELRDEACAHVLERAGSGDKELADAASRFVTETGETQLHAMLNAALGGERRKLERFLGSLPDTEAAIAQAIRSAHGARIEDTPESVEEMFCNEMKSEEVRLREVVGWLSGGKANDRKTAQSLLDAIQTNTFDAFADIFMTGSGEPRKRLATKDLIADNQYIYFYFESVGARLVAAEDRRRAVRASALAEAALTLIRAARIEYQAAKRARAALDYDDLIVAAQQLLERRDAAQWVLYKLDGGLDHVLIDEAQDTSPEQWAIVTRLTEEFFAGEGVDADARSPRTIFAVGDEKQSIFSFQGAEPREFEIHRRHFAGRIAQGAFVDVRLDVSRRSTPEVLRFVDEVFAAPDARRGVAADTAPIAHRAHREHDKGLVEFWPVLWATDAPEPDVWRPVDVPSEKSPVVRLADQIAAHIKSWTDGRTRLPGHEKPIRPGDIMVLMPRREPFASALIRELKARGVPVAGADRIRLEQQIAVMDLIALGRFALLPDDDLNLAALLRSPLGGLSEDELFALSAERKTSLWRELLQRKSDTVTVARAAEFLSACLGRADYTPPYEFYASVLSAPGARKRLLTRLGVEATDAIDEFLSLALTYEALNTPSLEGFLHWIEHGEAEVKRDMERGRDEVRVMTVHGAKGLEADIVILPDTTSLPDAPGKRGNILYTDDGPVFPIRDEIAPEAVKRAKDAAHARALEEHRRLLYVALTRARDRLYICGFGGKAGKNKRDAREGSWHALTARAAETIGEAVPRAGEILRIVGEPGFETAPPATAAAVQPLRPDEWAHKPVPVERETPRLIRPSEAAGVEEPGVLSPVGARNAQRFRRGNLVHALLAHLPEIAPTLRRDTAFAFLAARDVAPVEASALVAETLAVIDDPAFAAAFAAGARAEIAIVAELPELGEGARVSGRIDRLAVTQTEILAVDFKTNRPPPSRAADVPKLYVAQMALYRAALAKIFPGRRIACALVWTEGPSLMMLDEAVLEAETRTIGARLAAR
jgi:ATP-dependent helicase/nuclease subunit A